MPPLFFQQIEITIAGILRMPFYEEDKVDRFCPTFLHHICSSTDYHSVFVLTAAVVHNNVQLLNRSWIIAAVSATVKDILLEMFLKYA